MASLPGMIVAIFLAANALTNERTQIEENAKRLADIQAAQHTNVIENARVMMDTVVELLETRPVSETECTIFLNEWADRFPSFTSLTLIDQEGGLLCAGSESELPSHFPSSDFLETLGDSEEMVVSEYTVGQTGVPLIIAALPIREFGDRFSGAIAVGIDLRWLEFITRRLNLPPGSTVTAISDEGEVLTHYRAEGGDNEDLDAPRETIPVEDVRLQMATHGSGVIRGTSANGSDRVFGFERTDAGGLIIAVGMPQYMEFERYGTALRDTLAAPMAILLLALFAAAYASESLVVRWVRLLTGAAIRMSGGDLEARSKVPHSRYEIGRLAAAFDSMADSIQDKQEQIRARAEQYKDLLSELNHRVNNNMQMIGSLIRMKMKGVEDKQARLVIEDVEQRLRALSEIQRLLYGREDGLGEDPDYTLRLGRLLEEFYSSDRIKVRVEAEPIPIPRPSAVPLALIMNELITNACKHSYPDGEGEIRVALRKYGDDVHLSVSDDGAQVPGEWRPGQEQDSMGLRIIRSMAAHLGGDVEIRPQERGKSINLAFPLERPDK
ncbi:MAG: HAMP domain-containing protein [Salinarimonas sp.]|nr:HAMP domain-containing protein [Salinarimonas sp.]